MGTQTLGHLSRNSQIANGPAPSLPHAFVEDGAKIITEELAGKTCLLRCN